MPAHTIAALHIGHGSPLAYMVAPTRSPVRPSPQAVVIADEHQRALWGTQEFYRVFSSVNGGRARETDLFEGLR